MDIPDPRLSGLDRIILQFRAIKRDLELIEQLWSKSDGMAIPRRPDPDIGRPCIRRFR